MTELADEAATLSSNVGMLNDLHHSLGLFNESFAGWLYALKMNAFCVEWPLVSGSLLCLPSSVFQPLLSIPPSFTSSKDHILPILILLSPFFHRLEDVEIAGRVLID